MKVEFKKVVHDYSTISFKQGDISITGRFKKLSYLSVAVELYVDGKLLVDCDMCSKTIDLVIDEKIELKVYNGFFKDKNEELDVIECFDETIDFDQIAKSEIEAIVCDYHYCNKCKGK